MSYLKKLIVVLSLVFAPLAAAYTVTGGKMIKTDEVATHSVQEHYSLLLEAFHKEEWKEAMHQAAILIKNFPDSPLQHEAIFFLGSSYFHQEDNDIANDYLTQYLRKQTALQHFRDAIEMKFQIAERFRHGSKKHIGGYEILPKWMPAKQEALKIYDEVIAALPNDDLAARALFGKAMVEREETEYTASIESLQALIRRFPRHPLAPDVYVEIGRTYLLQSKNKYPDADFLDLADLNLKKFRQDFPTDERQGTAEQLLGEMQEVFAKSYYEIAKFYERTKKPHASILYYSKIVKAFPNSKSAERSKERLTALRPESTS
jgi:outer membrane protein assembly factor BamD (BamD/ComL family)